MAVISSTKQLVNVFTKKGRKKRTFSAIGNLPHFAINLVAMRPNGRRVVNGHSGQIKIYAIWDGLEISAHHPG